MYEIQQILEEKKVLRAKELLDLGVNRMALSRMSELMKIQKLGGGFYATIKIPFEEVGAMAVAKYYPHAVISNHTALRLYGLGLERITRIDIDIERTTNIQNEMVETHRVAKKFLTDIVEIDLHGFKVKIYSKQRCLYEAFKVYGQDEELHRVIVRYIEKYKDETDRQTSERLDKLFKTNIEGFLAQEVTNDFY
jgi:predicted transcriptional regulator of viral defense system